MSRPLLWQVTPPPARSVGGLTPAIDGMNLMAEAHGWEVIQQQGSAPRNPEKLPDMVHFHGLWEIQHWLIAGWCRGRKIPYLVSPHGMLEPWALSHRGWKKAIYLRLLERKHLLGARAIVTTSELEAGNVRRLLPRAAIEVAPLGMEPPPLADRQQLRSELGIPPTQPLLLFLSRIDRKKGLPHVLRALAANPVASEQGWRLVVVGPLDNAHAAECRQLAQDLADKLPRIDWLGGIWGQERFNWLRAADLMVLPTHSENFGLVVLEAMMVGTPVMTTRFTPWAELAGIDGIHLVEPNPESVAKFLNPGLEPWNDDQRNRLAQWTRSRYAWEKLTAAYRQVYGNPRDRTVEPNKFCP